MLAHCCTFRWSISKILRKYLAALQPFCAVLTAFCWIFWSRCQSTMFALSPSINFHCLKAVWGGVKSHLNGIFHGLPHASDFPWNHFPVFPFAMVLVSGRHFNLHAPHLCGAAFLGFSLLAALWFLSSFWPALCSLRPASLQIFNLSLLSSLAEGYQHLLSPLVAQ